MNTKTKVAIHIIGGQVSGMITNDPDVEIRIIVDDDEAWSELAEQHPIDLYNI